MRKTPFILTVSLNTMKKFPKKHLKVFCLATLVIIQIIGTINNIDLDYEIVKIGHSVSLFKMIILFFVVLVITSLNIFFILIRSNKKIVFKVILFLIITPITIFTSLIASTQSVFSYATNYATSLKHQVYSENCLIVGKSTKNDHGTYYLLHLKLDNANNKIQYPVQLNTFKEKQINDSISIKYYLCNDGTIYLDKNDLWK